MMRPIDADNLKAKMETTVMYGFDTYVACGVIDDEPTVDFEPVRHGRWVHDGGGYDGRDNWYHCSECNRTLNLICGKKLEDYPYCHCGAKMDGGEYK